MKYKDLCEKYRISYNKDCNLEDYDVVVAGLGSGYAVIKYRLIKNSPNLSDYDIALICDRGNLPFGYRRENDIFCIYTD